MTLERRPRREREAEPEVAESTEARTAASLGRYRTAAGERELRSRSDRAST